MGLLGEFCGCFTAPTFAVFCALAVGFLAQTARRTVCGMLVGARLSRVWSHHRAHRFFSHARWSPQQLSGHPDPPCCGDAGCRGQRSEGARRVLVPRRVGQRRAQGRLRQQLGARGDRRAAFLDRPLALPVGFALVRKGTEDSRLALARRLVEHLAAALPGRRVEVVADCAYAGRTLRALPAAITWTTRLRSNAALYQLAPPRTGRRGRPRLKGAKLACLASLADRAGFTATVVHRYGTSSTVPAAALNCLWYGVFGPQQVQVVLVRDTASTGYGIALVSTDLTASAAQVVERYAARWSIEVAIEDAKRTTGVGQARNRLPKAVERTVPFGLIISSLAICWYATTGYHPEDVTAARAQAPWYRDKAQPSVADMLTKLRRVIIAAQFRCTDPSRSHPTKSTSCDWPGPPLPHRYESRVIRLLQVGAVDAHARHGVPACARKLRTPILQTHGGLWRPAPPLVAVASGTLIPELTG